ncbi:hypothetical protein [Botrimarina sp.]|uniref:hypothetical protein n=1 Tax=Botrimarina sp. TaxID=2795802 RepID=UPI0032F04085
MLRFLFLLLAGTALVGCGEPRVVPVDATFTYDGEPLQQAAVTFVRQGEKGGRAAFGSTDDAGRLSLTTYSPNDGAPPGQYRVVVIKPPENEQTFEEVEVTDAESMVKASAPSAAEAPSRRNKWVRTLLPEAYADPGTTPLTCELSSRNNEFQFELSSKP